MSYRVTIDIVCDEPYCLEILHYTQVNQGGLTKTFAGARAALNEGWFVTGQGGNRDPKRAFCPKHLPKENSR